MPTSTNGSASSEGKYPFPANTLEGRIMRDTNDPEYMKLFLAAHDGDVEKVKKLVNKENVNNLFFHPDDGFKTALHCASERGRYEVVKALLLMEGAIVDYRDDEKMTPLLRAAFSPNDNTLSIIELLIIGKAQRNAVNALGDNALHIAIDREGSLELIRGLVKLDVDVNKINNDDEAPLHFAISKRSPELVKALLDGGADALLVDKDAKTYLHHLADFRGERHDDIKKIIILLIQGGVDIYEVDKKGRTALEIALENKNHNFADALKASAPLNSQATNEDSNEEKVKAWLDKIASANHAGSQNSSPPDVSPKILPFYQGLLKSLESNSSKERK